MCPEYVPVSALLDIGAWKPQVPTDLDAGKAARARVLVNARSLHAEQARYVLGSQEGLGEHLPALTPRPIGSRVFAHANHVHRSIGRGSWPPCPNDISTHILSRYPTNKHAASLPGDVKSALTAHES